MNKTYQDIWRKKSLILNFATSDLRIRYRNSVLGFFWTFLEPLLLLSVLYVVFTNLFKTQIEYFPLYLLLGIIMWNMFSRGTTIGLNGILARSNILTQIYIPLEIPSISGTITSFLMLCFEFSVFVIFMFAFHLVPTTTSIFFLYALLLEFILILALSLPLSILNVRFRDTQFIWGVILQIGFFVTPIFYKLDILPDYVQKILYFSPMVQIMNIARNAILYDKIPTSESLQVATVTTLLILFLGYLVFRKMKNRVMEEL